MLRLLLLPALFLALTACSATKPPPPNQSPEYYFRLGERNFEHGMYKEAIANWEKVRDTYYSPELTALAEIKIAEAHYDAEEYVEAAAAYEDFLKQHPNHPQTSQILYRLGMSYYKQILSPDRDQTATRNAMATFESLLRKYPDISEKAEVQAYIVECRNILAEHEFYVGNFYFRTDHDPGAIGRLKGLIAEYPDYPELDRAYFILIRAYLQEGKRDLAQEALKTLSKKFPTSEYLPKARDLFG
jgi:outer membrane protein assembly factor BamD